MFRIVVLGGVAALLGGARNQLDVIANLNREDPTLLWLQVVFNYLLMWLVAIPAPLVSSNYLYRTVPLRCPFGGPWVTVFP